MEKELEQKVFFEKNYENKNDLENEVNDYILDLRKKYPKAIVTKEFYKGKNILVRATEVHNKTALKTNENVKEIDDWYIRQRGGR